MAIILTTNTMGLLTMTCFGCLTIYSAATQCQGNQHCSECDNITGHCITDCDPGYYDMKCTSVCSDNCRHNKCIMSHTGNDYCTEGCIPGYQGLGCGKPCYSPGDNCTACPGVCDGRYCQLGSSCVSGCVDSFYGTGCKNCSSGCTTCNRMTGTCDEKPDESMTYLRIGLLASSLFLVFCVSVTIYTSFTKYLNRNREERHQEDEDDYLPNAPAEERGAHDAFGHSNSMYSEVNESDTGAVVVFLEGRDSN